MFLLEGIASIDFPGRFCPPRRSVEFRSNQSTPGRPYADSDYVYFSTLFTQKLKTRVIKKSTNPEWNEELTLSIENPADAVRVVCIPFYLIFLPFFAELAPSLYLIFLPFFPESAPSLWNSLPWVTKVPLHVAHMVFLF